MSGIIGDIFWVFLMLSMLMPWLQRKMLDVARTRQIRRIEAMRGSRLILLVHRQETMSFLGFPVFRYIDMEDAEQVIRAIHLTDRRIPLDIVLHTPGGLVLASIQIARAIKAHQGRVTVFVPHYAMSGGTLLALTADEIVMDSHAVLGPVDPQLGEYPAASLMRVLREKKPEDIHDKTFILADIAEKALHQIRDEVSDLLDKRMTSENAEKLAEQLTAGKWTHDHPIGFRQAQQLGLPVRTEMPTEVYELMDLYPQPVRRQPSVQYIPTPHGPPRNVGQPSGS